MSLNFLFEGCFLLLTLSGFAICQPSGNPSGSRVFESTRGASSEPLASVQGPRTENKFKDYQNWSLLRLYPSNSKTLKTLIDVIGSNAQAIVLNVQRKGSKFKIDVAISPEVTLSQLLSSSKNLPVLCCLDKAITQHQENKPQRPLKKSSSHPIDDFVRSPSVNVSHCVFPDDNPARDKYSNTGYTRPYRSLEFLKWVTISKHFKEIFNLATSRQLGTEDLFGWSRYYRYDNILQFSKNLANTSDNVGYIKTGVSYEGRELFALVFATKPRLVLRRYERKASVADRLLALGGIRFYQKTSQPQTPKEGPSSDKINRNKVLKKGKSKNSKLKEKNKKKKQSIDKSKTKKKESIKGNGKKQKVRKPRPFILIEAGAHAREWISPAVATYIAQQLSLAGSQFLKLVTVIVVPLTNPDGYEYTHTTDRFWRKNRRRNIDPSGCVGIDLNRNWNISWGNLDGTSNDPCSFQYCGDSAFSEPETRAIRNLTAIFLQKLSAYISLHSYGQLVLHPWGHTDKKPPEYKKLMSMGKKLLRALNNNSHSGYMAGQSSWVLYRSTGTSDDYMYNLGVPYTYTVELPNTDSFELPTSEILPTAEHVWEAFVCFVGEVIGTPRAKSFCSKRIVTAINDYNVTISSWVDKGVPLAEAKTRVLNDYKKKLADK